MTTLRTLTACFLTFLLSLAAAVAGKPNIILVMSDDQGWGDVAFREHPVLKTPHLDKMAAESLVLEQAYASAPVCSPSRASILTGRTPNRSTCYRHGHSMHPKEETLPQILKKYGYATGHFGKWHLGTLYKNSPVNPTAAGYDEWISAPNFFDIDPTLSNKGVATQYKGDSSEITMRLALDFIKRQSAAKQPFFTTVWYGSPHDPHKALDRDKVGYEKLGQHKANFLGEITELDRTVGELRAALRELGIEKETIVWFCSDNGGLKNLGVTGGRAHKGTVYEGGLRVPSIIEWPGKVKAGISKLPTNGSDMLPTVLELAGIEHQPKHPLDGVSIAKTVLGQEKAQPHPLGFWHYDVAGIGCWGEREMQALLKLQQAGQEVTDPKQLRSSGKPVKVSTKANSYPGHSAWLDYPWKLHRIESKKGKVSWELYNLALDPMESKNLTSEKKAEFEALKQAHLNWLQSVQTSMKGADYE
ncbi:Arylsulfatase A [Rubritalea squalenifaciens DSM 18772]|uniref:Arylsulfatase A n=1 Tax=Rubritalea squalenifaciens DSM 18772 TaxID=1123071 RepID=A0A1M6BHR4_9BACT|nr:sulfatase-like hydrolase/transferase [Rubritalea squalenifaciens]SHI48128.1 Arylsulfatase A [Rubritalea squalenifaciens DSM 18772]